MRNGPHECVYDYYGDDDYRNWRNNEKKEYFLFYLYYNGFPLLSKNLKEFKRVIGPIKSSSLQEGYDKLNEKLI